VFLDSYHCLICFDSFFTPAIRYRYLSAQTSFFVKLF